MRAANSHSKWEWADKMSSDVRIAKEEVKEKTSRKRKAGNGSYYVVIGFELLVVRFGLLV